MPRGRPTIYPWDTWLDGKEHRLNSAEHWAADVDVQSVRAQMLTEARKRGVEIETQVVRKGRPRNKSGLDWLRVAPRSTVPRRSTGQMDWPRIFGAGDITLEKGKDFDVTTTSMQSIALQAARRRGLSVTTKRKGKTLRIRTDLAPATSTIGTTLVTEMAPDEKE